MSRFRKLLIALAVYGAVFTIARSYQAEILEWVLASDTVSQLPLLEGLVERITTCGEGATSCDCRIETCTQPRRMDLDSPYTLGMGVMVGSLVVMPFPPRYLVFLSVYARDRPVAGVSPPEADGAAKHAQPARPNDEASRRSEGAERPGSTPRMTKPVVPRNLSEVWHFLTGTSGKLVVIAALALFFACMINYLLGVVLGLFWANQLQQGKWAKLHGWFDKLGLWIIAAGFLVPLGFPVSIFSCLAGIARTNLKRFALVCFLGSLVYFTELALIYPYLECVWSQGR